MFGTAESVNARKVEKSFHTLFDYSVMRLDLEMTAWSVISSEYLVPVDMAMNG